MIHYSGLIPTWQVQRFWFLFKAAVNDLFVLVAEAEVPLLSELPYILLPLDGKDQRTPSKHFHAFLAQEVQIYVSILQNRLQLSLLLTTSTVRDIGPPPPRLAIDPLWQSPTATAQYGNRRHLDLTRWVKFHSRYYQARQFQKELWLFGQALD